MKEGEPPPNTEIPQNELLEGAQLSLTRSQRRREYFREAKRRSRERIRLEEPERYQRELEANRDRNRVRYAADPEFRVYQAEKKRQWQQRRKLNNDTVLE